MKEFLAVVICTGFACLAGCSRGNTQPNQPIGYNTMTSGAGSASTATAAVNPATTPEAPGATPYGTTPYTTPGTVPVTTPVTARGANPAVTPGANPAATGEAANAPGPAATIPEGTRVRVRLVSPLDTRRNRAGDQFTASLDEPLIDGDRVVVPRGTLFTGHVTESKPSGRFKGRAVMALRLDSFSLNGRDYTLASGRSVRESANHKRHDLRWIGGGAGSGAAIGAVAGGGIGAAVGLGVGTAAGTVGSAVTGKMEVHLPAESVLRFTLREPVALD